MKEVIKSVGAILSEIVNYRYLRWRGKVLYPYFVGELHKSGSGDESGETEYRFLLTGFYRGEDDMQLYEAAEGILAMFPEDAGRLLLCCDGGMLVSCADILTDLPTDTDTELSKIEITLEVKRWKGNR